MSWCGHGPDLAIAGSPGCCSGKAGRPVSPVCIVYGVEKGWKVPQKKRKRRRLGGSRNGYHLLRPEQKDHVWCWDFVFDPTSSGSSLKSFSIVDEFTRECLTLKVDRSIRSEDVIDTLAELFSFRGVPQCIRSDNGPEFVSRANQCWLSQLEINSLYIEPGAS
jgi:transposase InsO family protein